MKRIFIFIILLVIFVPLSFSFAQSAPTEAVLGTNQNPTEATPGGLDTSFFNIWSGTGDANGTCNMLGYTCTFCDGLIVATNIIKFLLNLGIILAVVVILYAGIRFMTAGGSEKQVSEAKDIIKKAGLGLILIAAAWLIVGTIFSFLTNKNNWNTINPLNCPSSRLRVWDLPNKN